MISPAYLNYFAPEIIITIWAMVLLVAEAFLDISPRKMAAAALASIVFTALITLCYDSIPTTFWNGMARWDGAAKFYYLFFLAVAALVIWMADEVQEPVSHNGGEFVVLPLFITAGLMLLASANDFVMLFIALELVTISFYIVVAYQRRSIVALEAGVKYLILGSLASAFLVMGIAYIFGLTGHTDFDSLYKQFHLLDRAMSPGLDLGLLFVLIGIAFKVAMVPFHSWTPDVYEGAPNSITAFLSVGSKAGGLIILMRVVLGVFDVPSATDVWIPFLTIGAILSLLVGNLAASPQRNLKRLLGYSSIGHSGFILVAIIGSSATLGGKINLGSDIATGQFAVGVYLVSYLLATFAAFIVFAILERRLPGLELHHFAGLSQRSPLLAASLALSLVSLAGIPPLSGFFAKLYIVIVAWNQGLYLLLGVTIFAAVAALYYYLGPIKAMYWSEPLDESPIRLSPSTQFVLIALIVLLIGTGFWAQSIAFAVNGSSFIAQNGVISSSVALAQH